MNYSGIEHIYSGVEGNGVYVRTSYGVDSKRLSIFFIAQIGDISRDERIANV